MDKMHPQQEILEGCMEQALEAVDGIKDTQLRKALRDTPARWAKMMIEATSGHKFNMTVFDNPGYDEMVVETGIPFYSLCEHHIVPFFGTAVVAYVPDKKIVGISKLCRTVEHFSKSLQVQERMTQEIANLLEDKLAPKGVAVLIRARHLCQEMRGIKKTGVHTTTSCLKGVFREQVVRQEFMSIARNGK